MDLLGAHASAVDAGGRMLVTAALLALPQNPRTHVVMINEMVDENGNRLGWRPAIAALRVH